MKRKVFFRADGGAESGLGHVVRCCALADMLRNDFECHFFIREPAHNIQQMILGHCDQVHPLPHNANYNDEAAAWADTLSGEEIIVLDGYSFTLEYQQYIKVTGARLVCIDDIHDTPFVADAVINHAPGITIRNYIVEPYTSIFLGTDFLLLRAPFLNAVAKRKEKTAINSLFVCFGGSDFNNLTGKMLEAAILSGRLKTINLVVGSAFQHIDQLDASIRLHSANPNTQINLHCNIPAAALADIIAASDLAICPCSSILFEACALGTGLISGFYVDNQKHIFHYLDQKGIFIGVGDFNTVDIESIGKIISSMDVTQVNRQVGLQQEFIDGRSPQRLKKLFYKLDKEYGIKVRKVTAADVEIMFEWANDPETRANAINTAPISWEGHVQWFNRRIQDTSSHMFIFEHVTSKKRIGLTRFDLLNDTYLISYLVDKDHRGAGWGEVILKCGIAELMKAIGGRPKLKAMVKEGNHPSSQVFVNLGFAHKEPAILNNITYKVYEK